MALTNGIILGILAMLIWGTSDFFAAKASRSAGVFRTVFWSQLISIAIYLLAYPFMGKTQFISEAAAIMILIAGFLSISAYLSFYKALEIGKVSVISPIVACCAGVTVILSLVFLNETLSVLQAIGVIFAILGAILASLKHRDIRNLLPKDSEAGVKYALFTMLATGIIFVLIDVLVSELGWFMPMFLIRSAAVFYLLTYTLSAKKDITFPKNSTSLLIVVGTLEVAGILIYGAGITSEYTAVVAPIGAAFPVITIILARIFLKETLAANQKIGIISVLASLVLLSI